MKVNAIQCPHCRDIIFSRTRHDHRSCSCGKVFIDGGRDYERVGYADTEPERMEIEVEADSAALYRDWNLRGDKYGLIRNPNPTPADEPAITYRQLLAALQELSEEQLNCNVSVFVSGHGIDEFYPAQSFGCTDETIQVLDPKHPYLLV